MIRAFKTLDRVIRGQATQLPALREGAIDIPILPLALVLIVLGLFAGACTGLNAVVTRYDQDPQHVLWGYQQMLASAVKIPLLFVLTLIITFPSLYVFNALVGSQLGMLSMLRLLVAALCVMMSVVASFGLIVAFFALSSNSYPFMKLLNVVSYAIGGILGLSFLLQTLHRLSIAQFEAERIAASKAMAASEPVEDAIAAEGGEGMDDTGPALPGSPPHIPGALERLPVRPDPRVRTIFQIWVIVFGLVGAQMSWVLRPFIGDPSKPFSFFRPRESNFFQSVLDALHRLVS